MGQAIQSILTTPMDPYSKQISENKKRYKSRYERKKNNMEVGSLAQTWILCFGSFGSFPRQFYFDIEPNENPKSRER